uniref:NAD(P)H-quinone oxidoreductase subunit 6, chloroplastic n=1 Tax=Vaginularia trichoidea TaxID=474354 RepID=A0A3G5CTB7_9MONI|nr:NADH-plastoquinone oxidoreductase subunit 6 [Vaginularia trichoidea]AYW16127.1 NADH-plastoquinone oxidoreductase subunit 6 [Vaginularia trichoidea]
MTILIHRFVLTLIELGILVGSLGAVFLGNTASCAFSAGLVFTCISLFYFLLGVDFLATAQLLVYVGAINVLIVFAVMITDQSTSSNPVTYGVGSFVAFGACAILSSLLIDMIYNTNWFIPNLSNNLETAIKKISNSGVQQLGYRLLSEFVIPFELLSMLLLISLVGAINLARDDVSFSQDEEIPFSSLRDTSYFF